MTILVPRGPTVGHVRPMFELLPDECTCQRPRLQLCNTGCAARWPEPFPHNDLGTEEEEAEWRAFWAEQEAEEEQALLANL